MIPALARRPRILTADGRGISNAAATSFVGTKSKYPCSTLSATNSVVTIACENANE
jgi:hypothetical protein